MVLLENYTGPGLNLLNRQSWKERLACLLICCHHLHETEEKNNVMHPGKFSKEPTVEEAKVCGTIVPT